MVAEPGMRWTEILPDGTQLTLRALLAEDIPRQQAFFDELSPQSRRSAFLMAVTALRPTWLARLCDPSDERDVALVAEVLEAGSVHQIGLARYAWVSDEQGAELGVTVLDTWQRRGVGTALLRRLIEHAREQGVARLFSIDRSDNTAMRRLAEHFGATIERDPKDATQIVAALRLGPGGSEPTPHRRVREVLQEIADLEHELADLIQSQQVQFRYRLEGTKVRFEQSTRQRHAQLKASLGSWLRDSSPRNILSAPFIYGMIVPFVILDLTLGVYQAICFRLYRVPRVPRRRYIVIDRQHLSYLNAMEKLNCVYCGYAGGLLAYAREIAARTEQYWCPIKHARKVLDPHHRYRRFADFGFAREYQDHVRRMRAALAEEGSSKPDESA